MSKAFVKEILLDYEMDRNGATRKLREKQEVVYKKSPRIFEIEHELNLTGIRISKAVLERPAAVSSLLAELEKETAGLIAEKKTLLQELGYGENYLTLEYKCNKCMDTGFLDNMKCSCFLQKLVDKAYARSNISNASSLENFNTFDFSYYSTVKDEKEGISPKENMQRIYTRCLEFLEKFDTEFQNLLFYGNTGLGKTFLCHSIAKELLDMGKTVLYITAFQLFKMIEDSHFNKDELNEGKDVLNSIFYVDLLIIDDLGTEFSTVISSSEFFNIINQRLLEGKPSIISTNLSIKDIIHIYSDRIVSRLQGHFLLLKFFGDDIRIKKKYRK